MSRFNDIFSTIVPLSLDFINRANQNMYLTTYVIKYMQWNIIFDDAFEAEFYELNKAVQVECYAHLTRLYEKSPLPNPRGADRGAHVRSSNL